MACHKLGKRAYRVTRKFELVTITSPLFDMDFLKVDYTVAGLPVTGMALRQVGADMDMNKIETWVDPDLPSQGMTDSCGEPAGTIRMMFKPEHISPFTMNSQALVIHEGVHASLRRRKIAPAGLLGEAAAYLAQALFFEVKGESIVEAWERDNEWAMNLDHIEDPIQADSKARIYAAAEKVIDDFDLDSLPSSLTAGDVAELVGAIAKDPGYAKPAKPDAPKPRPDPPTWRERILERRRKRRARWRARRDG
jgi:hypothetical protein